MCDLRSLASHVANSFIANLPEEVRGNYRSAELLPWDEIKKQFQSDGKHHHLRLVCDVCGNVQTCRCREDKEEVVGICGECEEQRSIKTAKQIVREAMYWCHPGRTYRLTKQEQDGENPTCPKCKSKMEKEPFTKSEKLFRCTSCGFKVSTGKITTKKIEIEIEPNGGVDIEIKQAFSRRSR
jgi:hypothetical protein